MIRRSVVQPSTPPRSAPEAPLDTGTLRGESPSSLHIPTRWRWTVATSAQRALTEIYVPELHAHARQVAHLQGRTARDQDFPVELLRCVPWGARRPALLIVGGMGPLAGAQAMHSALERFGHEREIVLLQLCSVPDRTLALAENERLGVPSPLHHEVVQALRQGIAAAEAELETRHLGPVHVVVACNTAHNFVPGVIELNRPDEAPGWRLQSMVESVARSLTDTTGRGGLPVLVLGTDGTLRTRLYLDPLQTGGVTCVVPDPVAQTSLMAAIYQGVKAFDTDAVLHHGQALFRQLITTGAVGTAQPFVVLAACTEVPEIVTTLRERGDNDVRDLLVRATVADPLRITLDHIGRLDAGQ
ncbi:aspartate/glutamate racemase family protein [Hydrogenophaga sp. IBVHS2]|uniref:aspartate/glutamate racemase family protein n=1 Tax=Hydrogenophaga sp. IBVHS2 TaxID=1985170 RepID=UPI000A2D95E1|nr:aspartate/glutamate racemase family protein [Hydrogenophaga sp. IBVHS2]OSZ65608.1 hypothetical protein CAP38_05985 [Hydrogenophaga sp. IBVHS2]